MTGEEALKILKMGHNVFLTGKAGSGKTYLLNQYIKYLKQNDVAVGVTASTGIAATHMDGLTIHSWSGIGINDQMTDDEIRLLLFKDRLQQRFATTKVLIIDEISMLHSTRLDLVQRVARMFKANQKPFGGLQVVLCGDFFQLPPVSKGENPADYLAFKAPSWQDLNLRVCYLNTQYRQTDQAYSSLLNDIRGNTVSQETIETLRPRYQAAMTGEITKLYTHNADVDAINNIRLAELPGESRHFLMQSSGNPKLVTGLKQNCMAPEDLELKEGAVVMFLKNNFERGYVNGTLGTVIGFEESGNPVIKTRSGSIIEAKPEGWRIEDGQQKILAEIDQIPLRLAWAITVHKSQGMSLDAAEVDLSKSFEPGMGYVALSRIRTLAGLRLMGLNNTALTVNQEVLAVDQGFLELSQKAVQELSKLPSAEIKSLHDLFVGKSASSEPVKTYDVADIRKIHPKAYGKWTAEDDASLVSAFKSGKGVKELAKSFGRKVSAIYSRLGKLGL